jgi:GT2 family glycosyltransferase
LFLNPDTVVPEDYFEKTITYFDAHPKVGAMGPRLIDGKGRFSPDGKRSFPTLSVAIFKTLGINKLFPKSAYFNKYYAAHIGEYELAEIEVFSGCCIMTRRLLLSQIGGAFDEDYFMYSEDIDLCYRIQKAGYQNIYFPEVSVIHYKGESTRKATLSYVRIFNEALIIFVRKHYSKRHAGIFIFLINIGIFFRAILSLLRQFFRILKMPLFDSIIILLTLFTVNAVWIEQVKNQLPIPAHSIFITFPVYIFIWVATLFLNGAYDQPYRPIRVIRGMLAGIIFCLAYYGLLPPEVRHSRATIFLSGISGSILLVALHEVLHRMGIVKFVAYDMLPGNAVIVAEESVFNETAATLDKIHYAPTIYGRIAIENEENSSALSQLSSLKNFLYTADVDEIIFCVKGMSYATILKCMQECGSHYEYKIHIPGSQSFVGSNSSNTAGDLYTIDRRYNLSNTAHIRNKRVLDVLLSLLLMFMSPFILFLIKQPASFFRNCFLVLFGIRTWVGYSTANNQEQLPVIRASILPPFHILEGFSPNEKLLEKMDELYAQHYKTSHDLKLVFGNLKFLGRKS